MLQKQVTGRKRRLPGNSGMKKVWVALLFCVNSFWMASTLQAQKVEMRKQNITIEQFFASLKKQTGYSFLWDGTLLDSRKTIALSKDIHSLKDALDECLKGTDLTYKIQNRIVYILKKENYAAQPDVNPGNAKQTGLTIQGKVTDMNGNSLPASSIIVPGTPFGTMADAEGNYIMHNIPQGANVLVSYLGFKQKIFRVNKSGTVNFSLALNNTQLADVTVNTGLFSRNKSSFTGATSSFSAEDLAKVSSGDLFSTLSVLDPSFHIQENVANGSNPNSTQSLILRGGNSLNTTNTASSLFKYSNDPNTPLFILDGFEATQERINDLDMSRIARVDILKDAAATAIYGSRAANGVVVIETKKPVPGKLRVDYIGNMSLETPVLGSYNLMNAQEKLDLEQKAGVYHSVSNSTQDLLNIVYNARLANVQKGVNTDWIAKPVRNALGQKQYIGIEGGDNTILYGANLTYQDIQGAMKGSDRRTITGNSYLNYRTRNFQFRNDLTLAFNDANESPYGSFRQYTQLDPYWSPYDSSGNMNYYLETVNDLFGNRIALFDNYNNLDALPNITQNFRPTNPMYDATLDTRNSTYYQNIIDNFSIIWQVNSRLRIQNNFSFQKQKDESDYFLPAQATQFAAEETFSKGIYTKGYGTRNSLENTLTVNYSQQWGKHQLFATAANTIQQTAYNAYSFSVQGFPNAHLDDLTLGGKFPDNSKPTGNESISRLFGVVGQASYNYDNRYLLDLSFREDGSSQFGVNNHFAPFWSTGVGWNLQNERFMKNLSWITRFKPRYSVGYTGSQNFPSYLGTTTSQYYTNVAYRGVVSSYLLGYGNPNLKWQKTLKQNLGIDAVFFKKLTITANYYIENTTGSVATISTAPSTGFSSYSANLGNVRSKGWELYTNYMIYNNDKNRNSWSVFLNMTGVKSRITQLSKEIEAMNELADTSHSTTPLTRYAEGQSTTAIWAVRSLGIDPATGQEIFLNKDGHVVSTYNPADQVIVGDSRPKAMGSFGTNIEYAGIGLTAYFSFQFGGQVFNQTLIDRVENINLAYYNTDKRAAEDRWQKPGDHTFFKGIIDIRGNTVTTPTYASSRFVQDYNYLTLSNASIYYRFSDRWNKKAGLSNTRITLYTSDLFYSSSVKREMGLDYPYSKTFTLQLTTSF